MECNISTTILAVPHTMHRKTESPDKEGPMAWRSNPFSRLRTAAPAVPLLWSLAGGLYLLFLGLMLLWPGFGLHPDEYLLRSVQQGRPLELLIFPERGRFFPLHGQEFNLISLVSTSPDLLLSLQPPDTGHAVLMESSPPVRVCLRVELTRSARSDRRDRGARF